MKSLKDHIQEKKMDPVGKADADIDNDGDVDSSDKYLHNRRKAIKAVSPSSCEDKIARSISCNICSRFRCCSP